MCNHCLSQDEHDTRHGLTRQERLRRDPDYGDWKLEQEKDRKMEENIAVAEAADIHAGRLCRSSRRYLEIVAGQAE